jgi:hypothetical protein
MMLDKERKAERLAKVYKKKHIKNVKNGELQFSTKRIKMKEDNGCYHYIYIYTHTHARARKWKARRSYLKLLLATTFIRCCCKQVHARKKLQRLQHKAKEFSIKPVCDSRTNHLEERENDTIQSRSDSDF